MKVEWLNDDCTKARLVKGWLRPMEAVVERQHVPMTSWWVNYPATWFFIGTDIYVKGTWLERLRTRCMVKRDRRRDKQLIRDCWRLIKQTRRTKQLQGAYDSYELVRQVE